MKFDFGDFRENLFRSYKFGSNLEGELDASHEDLSTFYFCRRNYLAIKAFSSTDIVLRF